MGFYTVEPTLLPNLLLNRSTTVDPYEANHLYTDPLIPPSLPTLTLEAQGATSINTVSTGAKLPTMELSAMVGAIMTGLLSSPSLSAAASRPTLISLSEDLPPLELSSSTGARCGTLILPQMELSVSASGYIVGNLGLSMPGLSISATGSSTVLMSLDQDLPSLTLTVSMNGRVAGNLSESMPAFKITATGLPNEYGTLAASLPSLLLSAGAGHGASMTLDAEIATLIMQILASGASAGTGSASSASNASRFTDYVLRHVR